MNKYFKKNHYHPKPGRKFNAPSLTVPSQSYSVRELLARAQRGLCSLTPPQFGEQDETFDNDAMSFEDRFDLDRQMVQKQEEFNNLINQKHEDNMEGVPTNVSNVRTPTTNQSPTGEEGDDNA